MKKTVLGFVLAVLMGSVAYAQNNANLVTITEPDEGATIGKAFTLTGTNSNPTDCPMSNIVSLGNQADDTGNGELIGTYEITTTPAVSGTSFTYEVRIDEARFVTPGGDQGQKTPPEGTYSIEVPTKDGIGCTVGRVNDVTIAYVAPASPTATPSVTPAPSIVPRPVPPESGTGWLDNLDPVLVLAIGAVAGGGATGLAEYSWIRYRRKRRLKQGL